MNEPAITRAQLLARFDREMRANPPYEPGVRYEFGGGIVRARGTHNWIMSWDIDAADAFDVVGREAELFRALNAAVEWKVYAHDKPDNLVTALERHGFTPDEPETLMIYDTAQAPDEARAALPAGIEMRLVKDRAALADLVAITSQAFDDDGSWMREALPHRLFGVDACAEAFVAYADGTPVAGARVEYARERAFAGLWGGATLPAFRRRGIFAALVALRVDRARNAGYRYVTVDARETSRPSLERLGFRAVSTIVGWNLHPSQRRADNTETPARGIESHAV